MEESLLTIYEATIVVVFSFTEVTVLLPTPPKKPEPPTVMVTGLELNPALTLRLFTVGNGAFTVNLSAATVTLIPPRAATAMSYVPGYTPEGIITPVIVLSFGTAYPAASGSVPSFTNVTVLLPTPPKKPEPPTLMVTGFVLNPEITLKLLTTGAAVVTVYISAIKVALVPPAA